MSIVRYRQRPSDPALHDDIRQVFDRFLGAMESDTSNVATAQWIPRVDIREEAARFVIFADLPGIDPKDIEIQMDKGVLSIKGERQADPAGEGGRLSRAERVHGSFHRRFALPDSADAEGVSATGRNGVLEIVIPKKPESSPRRIQVGSATAH